MTSVTGTDATGPVEYFFTETSGNPGGDSSGWQGSTTYEDTGLTTSGRSKEQAEEILREGLVEQEQAIKEKVQNILENEVNPGLAGHGGFVKLTDVQGTKVFVELGGVVWCEPTTVLTDGLVVMLLVVLGWLDWFEQIRGDFYFHG